jgi:hypothetical protein
MTETDLHSLLVERYQPRHLTRDGEEMPEAQTWDEFISALRAEAKKPQPLSRQGYVPTATEARKAQNADADRFIEDRQREVLLAREARRAKREEEARIIEEVRLTRMANRVDSALSQGASLKQALKELRRSTNV